MFSFMFYSMQKCLASDYEKVAMNYICESSQTLGLTWHGALFLDLDCAVVPSLGLDVRITGGAFEKS